MNELRSRILKKDAATPEQTDIRYAISHYNNANKKMSKLKTFLDILDKAANVDKIESMYSKAPQAYKLALEISNDLIRCAGQLEDIK